MFKTLSTRSLSTAQKQKFYTADIDLITHDFIDIVFLSFKCPKVEHAIFTSQKAIESVMRNNIVIKRAYCVGRQTKAALEHSDIEVVCTAEDAFSLARRIVEQYSHHDFTLFCSDKRLNTLPDILTSKDISFDEITAYKTVFTPKCFHIYFDVVLFFSPSCVESFLQKNPAIGMAICIGNTTAASAKYHFDSVEVAKETTVESVIAQCIEYISRNDKK